MSDGLRHATVMALDLVFRWLPRPVIDAGSRRACDWERVYIFENSTFTYEAGVRLIGGASVELPTCPACAALLDLALEMRGRQEAA